MTYDLSSATAASIDTATEAAIAMAEALVAEAAGASSGQFADHVLPLDAAVGIIQDATGYGPFLSHFHPDASVRDAGNAANQRLSTWASDLVARREVYDAVMGVDADQLEGLERRSHDEWVRDLRRAGHDLEAAERARIQALRQRLIALQVEFSRNIAEYKDHLDVPVEALASMQASYRSSLEPGDAEGTLRVTLDYPAYVPFMEEMPDRALREALQYKYLTRAVEANRPLLEEALAIRWDIATSLGYADWAAYAMEVKMADPASVAEMYASIIPGLTALATEELAALEAMLADDDPDASFAAWDRQYYHTVQRRLQYGIDQNEVAAYFPLHAVVQGMLDVTSEVLGVTYTRLDDVATWHEDVITYRIDDADTGRARAMFHLDLHPREGKFTHAACWDPVNRHVAPDGSVRIPVAAVAANFTKPTGDTPSLLKHDEAVTLWHEFGHVLHATLTDVDVQRFAGYDTEWDFVEAPSQIMENWMWDADVLRRFARHHETGEPIPDQLVEGLVAARDQNVGLLTLRQVFLGQYDLTMHTAGPEPDLDALEAAASDYALVPRHEGTFMAASFGHLMGGYDAGYYGYLWAKVFGDDMFSVFEDEGVLSPAVGARYRSEVLARGSSRDAIDHLRAFLGREPNSDAFLRHLGIAGG